MPNNSVVLKVEIKRESPITDIPTSFNIFGYLFGQIIKMQKLDSKSINDKLVDISNSIFNISDVMPKNYIYNPSINYYINNPKEEFNNEKATMQKKFRKQTYVCKEYFDNNFEVLDGVGYLKMGADVDESNEIIEKYFKKYDYEINQHVQINTVDVNKEGIKQPQPFNTKRLNIDDIDFEFYIEIDNKFEDDINKILDNKGVMFLGPSSGKGYNMFTFSTKEKEQNIKNTNMYISLAKYIPNKIDEISGNENGNDIKLKNMSLRPVKKFNDDINDDRYRLFYIDSSALLKLTKQGYGVGKLLEYRNYENDEYKPKIFGKAYMYPVKEK